MYGSYRFPDWSVWIGWLVAVLPVIPLPLGAMYSLANADGSFMEVDYCYVMNYHRLCRYLIVLVLGLTSN